MNYYDSSHNDASDGENYTPKHQQKYDHSIYYDNKNVNIVSMEQCKRKMSSRCCNNTCNRTPSFVIVKLPNFIAANTTIATNRTLST